jgi:DNA-directed RNA polymerase subunit RPC12/RpoP
MTVYEVLTVALIVFLATAATALIYLGLLGMIGQLHLVRCAACNHLTFSSADQPKLSCPNCRHPVLLHPLRAVRHSRHPSGGQAGSPFQT